MAPNKRRPRDQQQAGSSNINTQHHPTQKFTTYLAALPECRRELVPASSSAACPVSCRSCSSQYRQRSFPAATARLLADATRIRSSMASDANGHNAQFPTPPPPLHIRSNEMDRPGTPSQDAFISPRQTPQGSPSKSHPPPGAFDLPHVFENAMKLFPTMGTPTKSKPDTPGSPSRLKIGTNVDHAPGDATAGSPTRKSNQENTPPGVRPTGLKEPGFLTQAAQSRQEPYRTQGGGGGSQRYYPAPPRLSQEELEKARKPAVRRLANVTQLCQCCCPLSLSLSRTLT